jgi:epoxide hydrolase 4
MISFRRRPLLSPSEMFPAGDQKYRVSFPRLRSGLTVRVVQTGSATHPPVVFLHGWGETVYVFRRNLPALADAGFHAIAIDLKGHGLSDKPRSAAEYSIESLVEHVVDILDALGIARAPLIGHSMGGSLLFHFAQRHPERVESLGLLSPVGLTGVPLMWLYRALTPSWLNPILPHFKSRTMIRIALKRVYGRRGSFTERDVEEFLAPAHFADYAPAMRELLHRYDWKAAKHRRLEAINVRAVGLWGSLDHLMPRDGMAIYERLMPGIALTRIEQAGHVIPEETPAEVNLALLGLLRGRGARRDYISSE